MKTLQNNWNSKQLDSKALTLQDNIDNGFSLEFIISSICNLNCANCDHTAPIQEPYFMSPEEAEYILQHLSDSKLQVKQFLLLGGEPTLNPDLITICEIVRQYYPDAHIAILSNGINILNLNLRRLSRVPNLHFSITPYPEAPCDYLALEHELNEQHIANGFLAQRFIFGNFIFTENNDPDNGFERCNKVNLPCLTIYKNRIYYCPLGYSYDTAIMHAESSENYLLLDDTFSQDKLIDFCKIEKPVCKLCTYSDTTLWHHFDQQQNYFNRSLKDIFYSNYSYYNYIVNNYKYLKATKTSPFFSTIDLNFGSRWNQRIYHRFFTSKIDIIIPIRHTTPAILSTLEQTLLQQTIINDCTIYLILDHSPEEEMIVDKFFNHMQLNCVVLKLSQLRGPGAARNLGLIYGCGKYIFFLDSDDYFLTNDALERLYAAAEENPYSKENKNIVSFNIFHSSTNANGMQKLFYPREYVEQNNLLFPKIYINEDGFFQSIALTTQRVITDQIVLNDIYYYNQEGNLNSISHTYDYTGLAAFLIDLFYLLQYQQYTNTNMFEGRYTMFLNRDSYSSHHFDLLLADFFNYYIINLLPNVHIVNDQALAHYEELQHIQFDKEQLLISLQNLDEIQTEEIASVKQMFKIYLGIDNFQSLIEYLNINNTCTPQYDINHFVMKCKESCPYKNGNFCLKQGQKIVKDTIAPQCLEQTDVSLSVIYKTKKIIKTNLKSFYDFKY